VTTIAYRDGIIAADSRETWECEIAGIAVFNRCTKLTRYDDIGAIIGTQGESFPGLVAEDWYVDNERSTNGVEKPDFSGEEDFTLLILSRDGLTIMDCWLRPCKVNEKYFAVGSGSKVALGAMYMGATAEEAVKAASKIDPFTGGKVHVMSLED